MLYNIILCMQAELKEIFEKKMKPLIRRQSAEQFDPEVHSSKGMDMYQDSITNYLNVSNSAV